MKELSEAKPVVGRMATLGIGMVSLVALVVQNATVVLMTRSAAQWKQYHTSTLVLNQELLKMLFCLALFAHERKVASAEAYVAALTGILNERSVLKLAVPAGLFTLQNFLLFVSLEHLDVMTFQVLSQTKLLSAALFTVWLLDRRISNWQWVSLVVLAGGVLLAQYDTTGSRKHTPPNPGTGNAPSFILGAISCVLSGLSSSFAGVYFEKVVKTTPPSLAVRNIQLGVFAIPMAIFSCLVLDVRRGGFHYWQGYSPFILALVTVHAAGGLLVAVVVKYADNILKGFATALAIVVSGVFASLFWSYSPTKAFLVGCSLVMASIVLYQYTEPPRAKPAAPDTPLVVVVADRPFGARGVTD